MALTYPLTVNITLNGQINDKGKPSDPDNLKTVVITGTGTVQSAGNYQITFHSNIALTNFDYAALQTQVLGGCCIICAREDTGGKNITSMGASYVQMDVLSTFANGFTLSMQSNCNIASPLNISGTINGGTGSANKIANPSSNASIILTPNANGDVLTGDGVVNHTPSIGGGSSFNIRTTHNLRFGTKPAPVNYPLTRTITEAGSYNSDGYVTNTVSAVKR